MSKSPESKRQRFQHHREDSTVGKPHSDDVAVDDDQTELINSSMDTTAVEQYHDADGNQTTTYDYGANSRFTDC